MKIKYWWITIDHRCIGAPPNLITQVIAVHPAKHMAMLRAKQAVTESYHLIQAIEIPARTMKELEGLI